MLRTPRTNFNFTNAVRFSRWKTNQFQRNYNNYSWTNKYSAILGFPGLIRNRNFSLSYNFCNSAYRWDTVMLPNQGASKTDKISLEEFKAFSHSFESKLFIPLKKTGNLAFLL